ncbi:type II toxin-antitoxin system VapC family toxin [Nostoc sp.]|uniref:type II toxin-antitoxin system VapC family toxin n=1 Tax=Nostoc sp. TaxID=1180 RepID=UPI003592F472
MKILLDTHIFLWFISSDNRLLTDVRDAIRNSDNEVYLSVVSIWESIVKYQLGKLPLPASPEIYLTKQRDRHQIANLDLAFIKGDSLRLALPTTETEYEKIQPNLFIERIRLNFCILNAIYGKL